MLSKRAIGVGLCFSGLVLPALAYVGGHIYNANVASYGGPPNQGAMILAYFAWMISIGVGCCLALAGGILVILSFRNRP